MSILGESNHTSLYMTLPARSWILASDTVFVNSTNISSNIETVMLSIWNKSWESMLDSSFLHITNNAQHWSWEHFELPVFSSEEIYDIGPFLLYACICAQMTITTVLNTEIYISTSKVCDSLSCLSPSSSVCQEPRTLNDIALEWSIQWKGYWGLLNSIGKYWHK